LRFADFSLPLQSALARAVSVCRLSSLQSPLQDDPELTAIVRSRQLHIYRNGKKILVLAGKSAPKIIREDPICELVVC